MSTGDDTGSVTDPLWESELARGQADDGGAGSVEPELAVVRLLLHARAPAELSPAIEQRIWDDVERGIAPVPWWKRRWMLWAMPALAAAAAVVIAVRIGGDRPGSDRPRGAAQASLSEQLERQFALLEPAARDAVADGVDRQRQALRGRLIASARGAEPPAGGAP